MDLGVSAYTSYRDDLPSFCALVAGLGLRRVELRNFIGSDDRVDVVATEPIAAELRAHDLASTVHAPWRLNLAASDDEERANALEHYRRAIDIAGSLGSDVVVFHGGWTEPGGEAEAHLDRSRDSIRNLLRHAEVLGVTIALENDEVSRPALFRLPEAFEALGLADLHYVLDVGHAHTLGLAADAFLRVFGRRLVEVHLHDNLGDADTHLPVGDGTIPWDAVVTALAPHDDLVYVLECKSVACMERSLLAIRQHFASLQSRSTSVRASGSST